MMKYLAFVLAFVVFFGVSISAYGAGLDLAVRDGEQRVALVGDTIWLEMTKTGGLDLIQDRIGLEVAQPGVFPVEIGEFSAMISVPQFPEAFDFPLDALAGGEDYSKTLFFLHRCLTTREDLHDLKILGQEAETAGLLDVWDGYFLWVEGLIEKQDECPALFLEPVRSDLGELRFYTRQIVPVVYPDQANILVNYVDGGWDLTGGEERRIRKGDLVFVYLPQTRTAQSYYELEGEHFELIWSREESFSDNSVMLRAVKTGSGSIMTEYIRWQHPALSRRHTFSIVE